MNFRFVNILLQTEVDDEGVWKILKELRRSYSNGSDCNYQNTLLSIEYIEKNTNFVKEQLKVNDTMIMTSTTKEKCDGWLCKTIEEVKLIMFENISKGTFQKVAEMFTYLNYCPPNLLLSFYKNLLMTASPKNIVIAMTNILKTTQNAAKESSLKVFEKIMDKILNGHLFFVPLHLALANGMFIYQNE